MNWGKGENYMSRIKLNPKYLETTIEEVKKNKELSNMKKDTIIK